MPLSINSKLIVLKSHPKAHAKRCKTRDGHEYWVIRLRPDSFNFAYGSTQEEAWEKAHEKI